MTCELCGGDLERKSRYDSSKAQCTRCGAVHSEEYIELRDVIVELEMVGEGVNDYRDPYFDTEKAAVIHTRGERTQIISGDIHQPLRTFTFRGQDEVGICGAFVHGEVHGDLVMEAQKVRVSAETYGDHDTRSIEIQNGGDFVNLTDRRW